MRSFGIFAALAAFSSVFAAPTLEAKNALKRRDDPVDMHTACKVYKMYGFLQDANNQARKYRIFILYYYHLIYFLFFRRADRERLDYHL